ncbi:hypothetical protein I3760_13G175300 [Carya illinoinensis]|nr:hypothetical protein I3760_13G175300 [Carya illinoinensis]
MRPYSIVANEIPDRYHIFYSHSEPSFPYSFAHMLSASMPTKHRPHSQCPTTPQPHIIHVNENPSSYSSSPALPIHLPNNEKCSNRKWLIQILDQSKLIM